MQLMYAKELIKHARIGARVEIINYGTSTKGIIRKMRKGEGKWSVKGIVIELLPRKEWKGDIAMGFLEKEAYMTKR